MTELIASVVAMATFLGFLGILVFSVPRIDLGAVVAITVLLAVADLIRRVGPRFAQRGRTAGK